MYIKADTKELFVNQSQIRSSFKNVSFPQIITDDLLQEFQIFPVAEVTKPTVDYTKNVSEGEPVNSDNHWEQTWVVTEATAEEIQERTNFQASLVRNQRNQLLSASDWTQLADAPVDSLTWAVYRQGLRDITTQTGFPWEVTWPVKP